MLNSPLRYPGGKSKLFPFFAELIHANQLKVINYCEPYAGGAGLALRLLSTGLVERISLNDVDEAIWAFWYSALTFNKEMRRLTETADLSVAEWYRQREIWRAKDMSDILSLGFATFYLNRTNRSGIIEGAGPIGGYSQSGNWKIDARFDREKQSSALYALAPFGSRIELSNTDALVFLDRTLQESGALTYLDPPYYVKGQKLYRNAYLHHDHVDVMHKIRNRREGLWVVSYDAVDPIIDMYREFSPIYYNLTYSAGSKISGKEVIYLSDALSCPMLEGFQAQVA